MIEWSSDQATYPSACGFWLLSSIYSPISGNKTHIQNMQNKWFHCKFYYVPKYFPYIGHDNNMDRHIQNLFLAEPNTAE